MQATGTVSVVVTQPLVAHAFVLVDSTKKKLDEFKQRVKTPSGVKAFFETSSEILTFVEEDNTVSFDIVNNGEHYIYNIGATGQHQIGLVSDGYINTYRFMEDTYFRKFLIMLSEAIIVSNKEKEV